MQVAPTRLASYCACHVLRQRLRLLHVNSRCFGQNHYEVLGLKSNADQAEIRTAFVKLSKEIHPDLNPNDPRNHEKFVKLNEAYTILSKPSSKRDYDLGLASRVYQHQNTVRNAYTGHTADMANRAGGRPRPSYESDAQQRAFWDETIWYMRDKSKDAGAFYKEDEYYGIKGVKRKSNTFVLTGCFVFLVLGVLLHLAALQYSNTISREFLDEKDRINLAHLQEARAKAQHLGNAKQLENLKAKLMAAAEARDQK